MPTRPLLELGRRISRVVSGTLEQIEPEVDRLLISGALVERAGEHFRIERGGESSEELEAQALRLQGLCDCGAPLCLSETLARCPRCTREFRLP